MKTYSDTVALYEAIDQIQAQAILTQVAQLLREELPEAESIFIGPDLEGNWVVCDIVDDRGTGLDDLLYSDPRGAERIAGFRGRAANLFQRLDSRQHFLRRGPREEFHDLYELPAAYKPRTDLLDLVDGACASLTEIADSLKGGAK